MRDGVILQRRLSLAGPKDRISPALIVIRVNVWFQLLLDANPTQVWIQHWYRLVTLTIFLSLAALTVAKMTTILSWWLIWQCHSDSIIKILRPCARRLNFTIILNDYADGSVAGAFISQFSSIPFKRCLLSYEKNVRTVHSIWTQYWDNKTIQ